MSVQLFVTFPPVPRHEVGDPAPTQVAGKSGREMVEATIDGILVLHSGK